MTWLLIAIGCIGLALVVAALLDEPDWTARVRTRLVVRPFDSVDMHPTDLERRIRRR